METIRFLHWDSSFFTPHSLFLELGLNNTNATRCYHGTAHALSRHSNSVLATEYASSWFLQPLRFAFEHHLPFETVVHTLSLFVTARNRTPEQIIILSVLCNLRHLQIYLSLSYLIVLRVLIGLVVRPLASSIVLINDSIFGSVDCVIPVQRNQLPAYSMLASANYSRIIPRSCKMINFFFESVCIAVYVSLAPISFWSFLVYIIGYPPFLILWFFSPLFLFNIDIIRSSYTY